MITTNIRVEDDLATVPFVKKNGYYRVGNLNYNFKINALEAATKLNQPVTWEYNNNIFRELNWRKSTGVSLNTLYRLRAEQLRHQYDYLVLAFSGGCESYTVLRSFIDNNIHLDEIICDWPLPITEKLKTSTDSSPSNYTSEWELTIKPVLEYVHQYHPKIKITVTNSLKELSIEDYEDTCTLTHNHSYVSVRRYRTILERIRTLSDQHSNVALIMGFEKPQILVKRNVFSVYFCDATCWIKSSVGNYTRNIEYFYSTPDMPEIILEQSHIIYQHLLANKHLIPYLTSQREFLRRLTRKLIFLSWNLAVFQADKATSTIYSEQYSFINSHAKTIEMQSWESSVSSRVKIIDRQYTNFFEDNRLHGYKNFYSRMYPLGII